MGIPLHVFGRLFFGFMIFAIILQRLGAGQFFNDLALAWIGKTKSGNAKVAIIASGFFSSKSGAPIANVMTTGAFTIPAMKKEGLPAHFAGAVEATASSGGALMPPVMGAVAFIMAEFLGVPYSEVAIAAAVPSVLYFLCLFAQIDSYGKRIGLVPPEITVDVPPVWLSMLRNSHIILSFGVLLYALFFLQLAAQGAWIATAAAIILALFRKETRLNFKGFVLMLADVGRVLGELMGIMGPVGMIIGSFIITGIAYSLPNEIVSLAGGSIVLVLLFGAIALFVLGMGVTISACYIFLAIVLAPGLVEFGFDPMAVHLFILYCGMMSYITPPVALTAFAAATISGANPMKTGFTAMKLGIAKYILPFIFILSPALILRGPVGESVYVITTCAIGLVILSGALEGYFWHLGNLKIPTRIILFTAGLLIAIPNVYTDLIGAIIFVVFFTAGFLLRGRENLLVEPVGE
jgi:TRAP transporter 4TM/12TM fusion protein